MAKTYTAAGSATAGEVYTAAAHNVIVTDVNNLIVPPMCRVYYSSTFSIVNNTHTIMTHSSTNSTEDIDTDGMLSLSATPSNITIQTAGVYAVSATFDFAANATGIRYARIVRNRGGTREGIASAQVASAGASNNTIMSLAGIISCNANDLIEMGVFQNSGGALDMAAWANQFGGNVLQVQWIGLTS
jgi:hypothetical protein